jgi:hypothetical protein
MFETLELIAMWLRENGFAIELMHATTGEYTIDIFPKMCGVPVGYIKVDGTTTTLYENRLDDNGRGRWGGAYGVSIGVYDLHDPNSLQRLGQDIKNRFKPILSAKQPNR